MKRRLLFFVVLLWVVCLGMGVFVACKNTPNPDPDTTPSKEVTYVDGEFYEGGVSTGKTLQDIVTHEYTQTGETLDGKVDLSIEYFDFFEEVSYTVTRTGATIDDVVYVDTAVNKTVVENSSSNFDLKVGYHGNWQLNVTFSKGSEINDTVSLPIDVKASHYNIYYLNATLPVLLATTQLYSDTHEGVTYMGLDRKATYDWYQLPDNVYGFPNTTYNDATTNLGLFDADGNEKTTVYGNQNWGTWGSIAQTSNPLHPVHTKKWIADLYAMDNSATFTFGCVDNSVVSSLMFGYGNSIPASQFNIKIYTDGTATTSTQMSNQLTTMVKYDEIRVEYNAFVENIVKNTPATIFGKTKFAFVMAEEENVDYIVNCKPAILEATTDAALKTKYDSNITQLSIEDAFNKVEQSGKTRNMEFLLRTRWIDNTGEEGSAQQYFQNENGKKSLMILGTSEAAEPGYGVDAKFLELMQYVVTNYSGEYNILYKGHPAWPLSRFTDGEQRTQFFNDNNITILPNATPAETYMYLYENVYVGGYYSTTFTSSQIGQTIFFFGAEASIKAQPSIAHMFDTQAEGYLGVFENSVFLNGTTIAQ